MLRIERLAVVGLEPVLRLIPDRLVGLCPGMDFLRIERAAELQERGVLRIVAQDGRAETWS